MYDSSDEELVYESSDDESTPPPLPPMAATAESSQPAKADDGTHLPVSAVQEGLGIHVSNADLMRLAVTRKEAKIDKEDKGGGKGGCSVCIWVIDSKGEPVGELASWPAKRGLLPVWDSGKTFGPLAEAATCRLCVELWEVSAESGVRSLLAGPAVLPLNKLPLELTCIEIPRRGCNNGRLHIRAFAAAPASTKRVFLVRHGESKWNAAKRSKKFYSMVKEHDHPLNEKGYGQARELQKELRRVMTNADGNAASTSDAASDHKQEALEAMVAAEALWASPLTRALQTALVGLEPLLTRPGAVLQLRANVREKKNWGGLDSIGRVVGVQCRERAVAELSELDVTEGGPTPTEVKKLRQIQVDHTEAAEAWWSEGVETEKEVDQRLGELLYQIQHSTASTIIVVAHSHLFRAIFKRFLHPTVFHRHAKLAQRLQTQSVPNGTVLDCEMAFNCPPFVLKNVRELTLGEAPGAAAAFKPKGASAKLPPPLPAEKPDRPSKLKTQSA